MNPLRCFPAALAAVFFLLCSTTAYAQFGFGAGVAAMGDASQAGINLIDLANKDSITYSDVSSGIGFYAIGQYKHGFGGALRLNADVAYIFFPAQEVTVREVNVADTSATFEVGTTLIPINLGLDIVLPIEFVRPYIGGQVSYTIVNRTFAFVQGDPSLNRPDIANESAGDGQFGVMVKGGVELALGGVALDLGLRYNLANLLSKADGETDMNYLQVGATLFFGDLLNEDEEDDDDDDREGRDSGRDRDGRRR